MKAELTRDAKERLVFLDIIARNEVLALLGEFEAWWNSTWLAKARAWAQDTHLEPNVFGRTMGDFVFLYSFSADDKQRIDVIDIQDLRI